MLRLFSFFALGQLAAGAVSPLAPLWAFFSPIEWISSLVLVMTGQAAFVDALVSTVTLAGHGAISAVVAAVLAGILGIMVCTSIELVVRHARASSPLGGKLFLATFVPMWALLMEYRALGRVSSAFRSCMASLENAPSYEMRLSAGFGVLLMAVIIPLLFLLCTKVLELILRPEKSYSGANG
jgi:hypothetical protein